MGEIHSYDSLRDRTGLPAFAAAREKTKLPFGSGMDWECTLLSIAAQQDWRPGKTEPVGGAEVGECGVSGSFATWGMI